MKSLKCSILAVIFAIMTIQITAEAYTDVKEDDKYSKAISQVTAFNLMNGYSDGTFRSETVVNRAEGTVIVSRILGLAADDSIGMFDDVTPDNWAFGEINSAAQSGVVSGVGSGRFEPDARLTKLQAAIMLLNTMGYRSVAEFYGGYPEGYIRIVEEKKLFAGTDHDPYSEITRGEFAQLISNALDVEIMILEKGTGGTTFVKEPDKTFLTSILGLGKFEGRVTGNEITMLTSGKALGKGMVMIDNELFNTGGTSLWTELGKTVRVYYKEDEFDQKDVIYYELKSNRDEITVTSEQIEDFKDNQLYYRETEVSRIKKLKVSDVADVIFNDKYKVAEDIDFLPEEGYVSLYDSDGDGVYDVVNIKSYVTYIVSSINDFKIYDKYGRGTIDLEDKQSVSIEYDGRKVGINEIKEDFVISVAADKISYINNYPRVDESSEIFDIKVSSAAIESAIDAVADDYVIIDGEKYGLSKCYTEAANTGNIRKFEPGLKGTFYLDFFGKVAGINADSNLSVEGNYGYMLYAGPADGDDETILIKAYDFALNDIIRLYCAKKVRVDGYQKSGLKIQDALRIQYNGEVTNEFVPRLFVYKTDGDGNINYIETDYNPNGNDARNVLVYDNNQQMRMFGGASFGGDIIVADNTRILAVPRVRAKGNMTFSGSTKEFIADTTQKEYIYFRKPSAFTAGSTRYTTETYNISESGEAELVVYYYTPTSTLTTISYLRDQTMMVEKSTRSIVEGEYGYEINGVCGDKNITLFLTDSLSQVFDVKQVEGETVATTINGDELKKGDIIRYSDVRQNTNLTLRVERIFNPDEDYDYKCDFYSQANPNSNLEKIPYLRDFNTAYGRVKVNDNSIIKVDFSKDMQGDDSYSYNLSGNVVNIFDSRYISEGNVKDLISYKQTADADTATKVVIISDSGKVIAVYAYLK